MINFCGFINSPLKYPTIYFITAFDIIYIGETQLHPIERWQAHLSTNGSFRRNIIKKADPEINYFNDLTFFAYSCKSIAEIFPEVKWKIVTQAVEHEIHCYVLQYPSRIGKRFKVISDTQKTAPSRFQEWDFAKQLSEKVIDSLVDFLNSNPV